MSSVLPELRHAAASDLEVVAEAGRHCSPDPWSSRLLSDLLSPSCSSAFVLVAEDTLFGYANVCVFGDGAELIRVAVLPKAWGQHLGLFLSRAGSRGICTRGVEAATLEVRTGNTAAIQLYEKYGFLLTDRGKNYYEKPVEDMLIYWNRILSAWKEEVTDV